MSEAKVDYVEELRAWTNTSSNELPIEPICETLEAYDALKSKLTEMESVLKWASENVWSVARPDYPDTTWELCSMTGDVTAPTLYEALWSAWKASQSK